MPLLATLQELQMWRRAVHHHSMRVKRLGFNLLRLGVLLRKLPLATDGSQRPSSASGTCAQPPVNHTSSNGPRPQRESVSVGSDLSTPPSFSASAWLANLPHLRTPPSSVREPLTRESLLATASSWASRHRTYIPVTPDAVGCVTSTSHDDRVSVDDVVRVPTNVHESWVFHRQNPALQNLATQSLGGPVDAFCASTELKSNMAKPGVLFADDRAGISRPGSNSPEDGAFAADALGVQASSSTDKDVLSVMRDAKAFLHACVASTHAEALHWRCRLADDGFTDQSREPEQRLHSADSQVSTRPNSDVGLGAMSAPDDSRSDSSELGALEVNLRLSDALATWRRICICNWRLRLAIGSWLDQDGAVTLRKAWIRWVNTIAEACITLEKAQSHHAWRLRSALLGLHRRCARQKAQRIIEANTPRRSLTFPKLRVAIATWRRYHAVTHADASQRIDRHRSTTTTPKQLVDRVQPHYNSTSQTSQLVHIRLAIRDLLGT